MNSVALVGRLTHDPEIKENPDGSIRVVIDLAINRDYKNAEGVYETDFIRCTLWNEIANKTKEYCHKGDVIGIKGKLQTNSYENNKNEKRYVLEVIVNKLSFINCRGINKSEKEER